MQFAIETVESAADHTVCVDSIGRCVFFSIDLLRVDLDLLGARCDPHQPGRSAAHTWR